MWIGTRGSHFQVFGRPACCEGPAPRAAPANAQTESQRAPLTRPSLENVDRLALFSRPAPHCHALHPLRTASRLK